MWKNNCVKELIAARSQTYWFAQDSPGLEGTVLDKIRGLTRAWHVLVFAKCPLYPQETAISQFWTSKMHWQTAL